MTAILGISAFFHDAAAALVVDGRIVAAVQEERFSRVKHDARFPREAIAACLAEAGLGPDEIDHVVFHEKPFRKFERLLETHLGVAPRGGRAFLRALPVWLHDKLRLPVRMNAGLRGRYRRPFLFTEHHEAHAASAFLPSPFDRAAILTVDGVGERATASIGRGDGRRIELLVEMDFPHSLGLLYSAFTYHCGFRVNSGEYKLMGLAPYGRPRYEEAILTELLDLKADGSFRLDQRYFAYCGGLTMTSPRFAARFGGPARRPEAPLGQREMDLAASIQRVTETILLRMARHARELTGCDRLCLAGGVALNCVANGRLSREAGFRDIWVQPAAGDAGGALGAALFVWHQLLEKPRTPAAGDAMSGSLLGPEESEAEIAAALSAAGAVFERAVSDGDLCRQVAEWLADGQAVAWVQGRMEFGPRALGARSILADPRDPEMQRRLNRKIKFRESFRPFAPAVLAERAAEFFDLRPGEESPYMLQVAAVRGTGLPAVTHVDGSARVQTVDETRQPLFHALLSAFAARTGCPVLVNTSFNVRGEPLVRTAADAYRCFMATGLDALAVGPFLLHKAAQPEADADAVVAYRHQHALD